MKRIIVAGAIANKLFNGGATWTRLSWVLGFRRLGFDIRFLEQIASSACVDDAGATADFERCANLDYFRRVTREFGLDGSSALIYEDGQRVFGASLSELSAWVASADLLVNISGHLTLAPLKRAARHKSYIDLDPGFTQFWHASGNAGARLDGHDSYFTVGENIGLAQCPIPTGGVPWQPIRQPVVLEAWPVSSEGSADRFTTVASWRGPYGPVEYNGRTYGIKAHQFRRFMDLPRRAHHSWEIALDIHPSDEKDKNELERNGWKIRNPRDVTGDPAAFRHYVQTSGAEFSAAQGIYVDTRSGWFSDRSVRYLSSGKPVLVQDTGLGDRYPLGEGLLTFSTPEEAIVGANEIVTNYPKHALAARRLAEAYFDSDKVLGELLDRTGLAP